MAAKIAEALNVTVDYLVGQSENMVMDKNLVRRMEDIEALPTEEKDKVYYFIDMAWPIIKPRKHSLINRQIKSRRSFNPLPPAKASRLLGATKTQLAA